MITRTLAIQRENSKREQEWEAEIQKRMEWKKHVIDSHTSKETTIKGDFATWYLKMKKNNCVAAVSGRAHHWDVHTGDRSAEYDAHTGFTHEINESGLPEERLHENQELANKSDFSDKLEEAKAKHAEDVKEIEESYEDIKGGNAEGPAR